MRCLFFFVAVPCLLAQAISPDTASVVAFDVASVKPAVADVGRFSSKVTSTTLSYSNVTLAFCVERAYGLKTWQVIVPDWMKTELYGIEGEDVGGCAAGADDGDASNLTPGQVSSEPRMNRSRRCLCMFWAPRGIIMASRLRCSRRAALEPDMDRAFRSHGCGFSNLSASQ